MTDEEIERSKKDRSVAAVQARRARECVGREQHRQGIHEEARRAALNAIFIVSNRGWKAQRKAAYDAAERIYLQ